jgi:putative intracellular protease/amidase
MENKKTNRVLVVVSENGFWFEELIKPLKRLKEAGFEIQLATPKGNMPFPDGASLDPEYKDPPLDKPVTSKELAEYGKSIDWKDFFKDRIILKDWFPVRPYLSAKNHLRELEEYYKYRTKAWARIAEYDALLLVGGSGPLADMVNNGAVHDLVLGFYYANKPIAAECYAVTCLAFAREWDERQSILRGRHVTGHTMEYDYTDGWSLFIHGQYFNFGGPPFPLEYILRDTVGPEGQFHGNVGRDLSVVVDYPFITSRSVAESDLCGELLVKTLKEGLTRYGW